MSIEKNPNTLAVLFDTLKCYKCLIHSLISNRGNETFGFRSDESAFSHLENCLANFSVKLGRFIWVSISVADVTITALQQSANADSNSIQLDTNINALRTVLDAMVACKDMRVADAEVLQQCIELPREEVESFSKINDFRSWLVLHDISGYPWSYSKRHTLPIEDYLAHMKIWWEKSGPDLGHSIISSESPLNRDPIGSMISLCEEFIAEVGVSAALYFGQQNLGYITPRHELLRTIAREEGVLKIEQNNHEVITRMHQHMKVRHERLSGSISHLSWTFDPHWSSAVEYIAHSLLTFEPDHALREVATRYTNILSCTLRCMELQLRMESYLAWHIRASHCLTDLPGVFQPIFDYQDDLIGTVNKAKLELNDLKISISEVIEAYPSHGCYLGPIGLRDHTRVLECTHCLLQSLERHADWISRQVDDFGLIEISAMLVHALNHQRTALS
ncbi:hypothetical protein NP233_g11566 [Leucocoprinus birnbaumii]|uniref:Uncharacterized protein n=1 Tax=Leucocoprinus birnbaumii TaxID=56174 RepID=A0AAD5VGX7_9AGAR|nr:hypothetical protein NP233_g11566 [Leucocoprinus birnbaumii]